MDFIAIRDFEAPRIVATGNLKQPTKVVMRKIPAKTFFTKGEVIRNEKGEPLYLFVKPDMHVPLCNLRQVVTQNIPGVPLVTNQSRIDGIPATAPSQPAQTRAKVSMINNKKTKYVDFAIAGGVVGVIGAIIAEKNFEMDLGSNGKWIAGGVCAVGAMYLAYRMQAMEVLKTNKPILVNS